MKVVTQAFKRQTSGNAILSVFVRYRLASERYALTWLDLLQDSGREKKNTRHTDAATLWSYHVFV